MRFTSRCEIKKEFFVNASLNNSEKLLLNGVNFIDDENVVPIVRLARKYGVEEVIIKCEEFLIKYSKKSPEHLTILAEEFNFDLLKQFLKRPTLNQKMIDCLDCPVCYSVNKDIPRILQCGHTFCNNCLNQLRSAKCPMCNKAFAPGSATLNHALQNVINAVSAKPTNPLKAQEMSTTTKKFVIFYNSDEYPSDIVYPEQIHFGLYWQISVKRKNERVTFCLTCRLPDSRETESIDADIAYRIVWENGTSEIGKSNHRFLLGSLSNESTTVSSRTRKFMLEFRVEIETAAKFEDISMKNHELVLLNMGDAAIYVPIKLLDSHFKKFQPTISKNSGNSEQLMIDSSIEDFMDLLFIVEGYRVLNENNVVNILRIAKTHGVDTVVEQCEQYLMNKSMKPSAELIQIAEEFSLDSLKSSIENSIISAPTVTEEPENPVSAINPTTREFVISAEYDGTFPKDIFYGREEFHSNFYWRIHIERKRKSLNYGLECRQISEWNSHFSLTARIEHCVISKTEDFKRNARVFQFEGPSPIFWNNVHKPPVLLTVQFKVEIVKVVGMGLAEESSLESLNSSIEHSIVSAAKVTENPEKTVKLNENEFVISAEYDGTLPNNIFYGREELISSFYWRIHIGHRKKALSYGLECRPISDWNSQLSLTARIESCVISQSKELKNIAPAFKFDGSNQICWTYCNKPAAHLKIDFKVKIIKVVGMGLVTNASLSTNDTVSLIVKGKKYKLPKIFLTSHFKNFQSNLLENLEIEASIYDFEKLLSILEGVSVIDDDNVMPIVRVAHKYGVELALRKCEQFLIKNSKKSSENLTRIAEEFHLDLLKHFQASQKPNQKTMDCLECPVCYTTYTDIPRILQCGHTFCLECLNRLRNAVSSEPIMLLRCPICCRAFAPGSEALNYALMNVIDAVSPTVRRSQPAPNIPNWTALNVPVRRECGQCEEKKFIIYSLLSILFFVWFLPKLLTGSA